MRFLAISFADSLTRTAGFSRERQECILMTPRQRESANASRRIRDRIASWIYRGGSADAGLLRPLTIAAVFVCSEGNDRAVRRSEPF